MKHPDINRTVMYDGMICRIVGVTYSHRECIGGVAYHLMPEGKHSLKDMIQYVTVNKMAFDPPVVRDCLGVPVSGIALVKS